MLLFLASSFSKARALRLLSNGTETIFSLHMSNMMYPYFINERSFSCVYLQSFVYLLNFPISVIRGFYLTGTD